MTMKYIKKVILENFQSHKYSEINFENGLNVIIGPSDQGKSAIIRGIKWALFNEPSGDFFIKKGQKECSVTILFSDGVKVKRYRSKSKNLYLLYDENGNESIYEGFGTKVPEEIINRTNIKKIYLDGNESNSINISEQLEGPFLISEKNVTRANAIGRIVGAHIIDDAISSTLKDMRNLKLNRKNLESQLIELNSNIKEYKYLDTLKETVYKLDILKKHIKQNREKLNKLKKIKLIYDVNNQKIKNMKEVVLKLQHLDYAMKIFKVLNKHIKNYTFISQQKLKLVNNINNISYNERIIKKLANIENIKKIINLLNTNIKKEKKFISISSKYSDIVYNYKYNKKIIEDLKQMKKLENVIKLIYSDYKKLNNLLNLLVKIEDLNKRIVLGNSYLNKLDSIEYVDEITNIINMKNSKLLKLCDVNNNKTDLNLSIKKFKSVIDSQKEKINGSLQKYKSLLLKFEVCPLCLNKINDECIEKIINNYK